jgi:hypothetical protein
MKIPTCRDSKTAEAAQRKNKKIRRAGYGDEKKSIQALKCIAYFKKYRISWSFLPVEENSVEVAKHFECMRN